MDREGIEPSSDLRNQVPLPDPVMESTGIEPAMLPSVGPDYST
jgi:hypothetical protein